MRPQTDAGMLTRIIARKREASNGILPNQYPPQGGWG
jgi:hypothetical protein